MKPKTSETIAHQRLSTRLWRGVTLQLFLIAILPLVLLVLLVTFGSLQLHHEAMRSLVGDRNLRAVQSAAANLSKEIDHRGRTLELLTRQISTGESTTDVLVRAQDDLLVFEGGVAALDPAGEITTVVGSDEIQKFSTSAEWATVLAVLQNGTTGSASYLHVQTIEEQLYVPVVVNTSTSGGLVGLFSPGILLSEGLAIVSKDEPVTVMVVDENYQVLYQSGNFGTDGRMPPHPGMQDALEGNSKIDYLPTSEGEHVITTSAIQSVGWALMMEESWEDIASPLLRATQNAPLIIIPVLGLSLLALWFGLRQIVQPLQALERKASDLAHGNFESMRQPVGGVPEIGHLQESLIEMAAQLKDAENSLHNYIGAITDSVESERRNLARELHDETLQSLIALGQYTQYALHWNKDPKVEKTLNQIITLADDGMKNLRQVVQGLRPIYIEDLGLATALAMQATSAESKDDIHIHFQRVGKERRLKPEVEMALYRIAQEALNNVRRHSQAANAWITLRFSDNEVELEIRDDGQGFSLPPEPTQFARNGHYGLLGMHERSELIEANLVIRSTSGKGTQILVSLTDPVHTTPALHG